MNSEQLLGNRYQGIVVNSGSWGDVFNKFVLGDLDSQGTFLTTTADFTVIFCSRINDLVNVLLRFMSIFQD